LASRNVGGGDHALAAHRIEAAAALGAVVLRDRVGAVEGVVEAAPAGVGGVQRIAGVVDRHHQLRAGDAGDLGSTLAVVMLKVRPLRLQVADLGQEGRP
jgi:hypothetical protein